MLHGTVDIRLVNVANLRNPAIFAIHQAYGFAACAHVNQKRKYTGDPYIDHCVEVAALLSGVSQDHEAIQAALLHDTLEDTAVTVEQLIDVFGGRVARLVMEVTDVSKPEHGNRAVRKEMDRQHLAKSSAAGATIKLADIISNTKTIVALDKNFAKAYIPEKLAVLEVIKHGDHNLWAVAYHQLKAHEASLAA